MPQASSENRPLYTTRIMSPFHLRSAGHEHLAEVPILVLANKKDLRDAMTASELTTALALTDVKVRAPR
jgi:signal recognition particle receptor subunit beta